MRRKAVVKVGHVGLSFPRWSDSVATMATTASAAISAKAPS